MRKGEREREREARERESPNLAEMRREEHGARLLAPSETSSFYPRFRNSNHKRWRLTDREIIKIRYAKTLLWRSVHRLKKKILIDKLI